MKKLMQTARCSTSDYFMSISGNGVICDGIFLRKQINVFKIWELSLGEFSSISIVNTRNKAHLSLNCLDKIKDPKCFKCNEFDHVSAKCPKF
ncbi:cadherin-23-like [Vespula maculifrons]|uniref:Cadherin-23-like n=1 Tax=Vespula maculifrons TaxID=7453 RepID=A0ABD2C3W3_VESMC